MAARVLAVGLALLMLLDILIYHTSVAFVSRQPANLLRSAILALLSFAQIPVAFAVAYSCSATCFNVTLTWDRAIYFSVVTATTVGYGDIVPKPDAGFVRFTVIVEIITSVAFLGVILARLISLTAATGSNAPGGLKARARGAVEQRDAPDVAPG